MRKPDCNAARLVWRFHPPSRRKIDVQNLIGALKAHVDGIADAMGIDDSTFRHAWPETLSEPVKGGAIIVEVTPLQIGEAQRVAA